MSNNLRRAFDLVLDRTNRGRIVACGRISGFKNQRYIIIELMAQAGFITEIWDDRSPVKVIDSLKVGEQVILKIMNNETAMWVPDYPDTHIQQERPAKSTYNRRQQPPKENSQGVGTPPSAPKPQATPAPVVNIRSKEQAHGSNG